MTEREDAIIVFRGAHRFLSNFFIADAPVLYDGALWATSEHAYQAAKTFDLNWKREVQQQPTPGRAKRRGQIVDKREDWDKVKVGIMLEILRAKFGGNTSLRNKLLATGDAQLVEGNTWGDVFWGFCKGEGENHLGRLLMQVRAELQNQS